MPESNTQRADRDLLIEMNTKLGILISQSETHTKQLSELRNEHGKLLDGHENRLTMVETDRKARMPEYEELKLTVKANTSIIKEMSGAIKGIKGLFAVVTFVIAIVGFAGGYMLNGKGPNSQTQTTTSTQTQSR